MAELCEDAARAMKRLTKAQRDAVLRGSIGDHSMLTVRALIRKGIMYHHIDSPNGRCGPVQLTTFGDAVATAIRALATQESEK